MPVSDEADRKAARLRLEVNIVVEAGAGTGKTTLLIDRILFLLLGREEPCVVPIGSLVALTFTEKAAGEIKLRLSERLVELVAALSGERPAPRAAVFLKEVGEVFPKALPKALERARAALEDMDKAQIGTIHGFAAHLLRLYPLQAGLSPDFRVDEGDFFEELFAAEWDRWLDEELGEQAPRQKEWLSVLRLCRLEDLEALARGLCAEGFDWEEAAEPDMEAARFLEEAARRLRRAHEGQKPPKGNSKILQALEKLSAHLEALAAAVGAPSPALPLQERPGDLIESKWPSHWNAADQPLYEDMLVLARRCSAGSQALLRASRALLAPFASSFRRAYTRAGFVSFNGLLRKARDLVRDHPDVRGELKRRYACLLIDEFQDTDPLQGELLLLLSEEKSGRAGDWRKAKLEPGRLFIVGDPKQSIYRFRGADIAAYQQFTARVLESGGALACRLRANFRSHQGLVEPVNAVFSRLMSFQEGSQPAYEAIEAHGRRQPPGPSLEIVCIGGEGGEESAASVQRAEAAWAAEWIGQNCGAEKLAYKDVALLMRGATSLAPLLEALKGRAIPYAVEMESFFYGVPEVVDLSNLLRALDDPGDRAALAGLLRSPLVALEDAALYRLARGGRLNYLREPSGLAGQELERVKAFYLGLRRLRERVGRVPLGDLVHAVLEETNLLETAARAYYGQQTVSNLLKFGRLASEAGEGRGATLKEFIGEVARAERGLRPEGESPLVDEHLDAVRILSIHKAKGLEFPVVLLMNASGKRGGQGLQRETVVDWSSGRVGLAMGGKADVVMARWALKEKARQEDEAVRLLYVALTRAKDRLILLGARKAQAASLSGRLQEAGAWPREGQQSLDLGGHDVPVRFAAATGDGSVGPAPRRQSRPARSWPPARALADRWKARLRARDAALARFWTTHPTDQLEGEWARAEPAGGVCSADGARVGQACHLVLQEWDFAAAADPSAALRRACGRLSRLDPEADWAAVEKESLAILRGFLSSACARELAGVDIVGREVPLLTQESGGVMRGVADLIYRKDGRVYVADYKTQRAYSKNLEAVKAKYAAQGAAYCRAVEKALGVEKAFFRLIFLRGGFDAVL